MRVGIITLSDSAFLGQREDESGTVIEKITKWCIDRCCRTAGGRFLRRLRNYATADSWILSLLLEGQASPLRIKPQKRLWISWSG